MLLVRLHHVATYSVVHPPLTVTKKIIKHFVLAKGNLKKDCKKEEMLKKNILKIKLKIDLTDKKMLLRSTSRERNQDSTLKNVSTNIQHKQTQLLVVWVN